MNWWLHSWRRSENNIFIDSAKKTKGWPKCSFLDALASFDFKLSQTKSVREAPFWNVLFPYICITLKGGGGCKACQDGSDHSFQLGWCTNNYLNKVRKLTSPSKIPNHWVGRMSHFSLRAQGWVGGTIYLGENKNPSLEKMEKVFIIIIFRKFDLIIYDYQRTS